MFPVKNKTGEKFSVVVNNTPFYDDVGTFIGVICVSCDLRPFQEMKVPLVGVEFQDPETSFGCFPTTSSATEVGVGDPQQPLQNSFAVKITDLVSDLLVSFHLF